MTHPNAAPAAGNIHEQFIEAAFHAVRMAEDEQMAIKSELQTATHLLTQKLTGAETRLAEAWLQLEALMKETGEYEVTLAGDGYDTKIGYSTPRQSVKIVDPAAVPDALCKIERKPKLKEIGDLLKAGEKLNWCSLEYGEKKLGWRVVKHQSKELTNV